MEDEPTLTINPTNRAVMDTVVWLSLARPQPQINYNKTTLDLLKRIVQDLGDYVTHDVLLEALKIKGWLVEPNHSNPELFHCNAPDYCYKGMQYMSLAIKHGRRRR